MSNYLLVPGGGWRGFVWRLVAERLRAAGHGVFTPTLTGLGERSHLASPQIDLHLHNQDIPGVLAHEDLYRVVLVGHSYGGMGITGVAKQASERLSHLVYLDAMAPQDGQACVDLRDMALVQAWKDLVRAQGAGWYMPLPSHAPQGMTPHPWRSLTQPCTV
jgi:pimeloyl-ACP methyl ester carboxylesterase